MACFVVVVGGGFAQSAPVSIRLAGKACVYACDGVCLCVRAFVCECVCVCVRVRASVRVGVWVLVRACVSE